MNLVTYLMQQTGLSAFALFGPNGKVTLRSDTSGHVTVATWALQGRPPTDGELADIAALPEPATAAPTLVEIASVVENMRMATASAASALEVLSAQIKELEKKAKEDIPKFNVLK